MILSVEHNIDLQLTHSYSLGHLPFSISTANGIAKPDKATLLHILETSTEPATKSSDNTVFNLLSKKPWIDIVTDTYKPLSVRSFERQQRGTTPTYPLAEPKTNAPRGLKIPSQMTQTNSSSSNCSCMNDRKINMPRSPMRGKYSLSMPKNAIGYPSKIQKTCQLRRLTPCPRLQKTLIY